MQYIAETIQGIEDISIKEIKQLNLKILKIDINKITFEANEIPDLKSITKLNNKRIKRDYRIKTHGKSINSALVYAAIVLSEFNSKQTLLNPLTIDGTIAIEASLYSKGEVIAATPYLGYLKSSRINSKIAQTNIEFIHEKLENLPNKTKTVDIIITYLISPSKIVSTTKAEKLYKTLLETTNKLLKRNGKLIIIINKKDLFLELCNLKLTKEVKTQSGEEINYILLFKKD